MPDTKMPDAKLTKPNHPTNTHESSSYLNGLYAEFHEQLVKYSRLTGELLALEAQIELAEKVMCLTRDHFAMTIAKTEDAVPHYWDTAMRKVRFVGMRLADACGLVLEEHRKLTPEQLLVELNHGSFRFRTNSPLREIHAALIKHPRVSKGEGFYQWVGAAEKQLPMRMKALDAVSPIPEEARDKKNELKTKAVN